MKLSPDDQRGFAGKIGKIAEHIAGQKLTQPHNPAAFIAERRFESFLTADDPPAARKFRHAQNSPEGRAWDAHFRSQGKLGVPWGPGDGFWSFDTEWPPNCDAAAAVATGSGPSDVAQGTRGSDA